MGHAPVVAMSEQENRRESPTSPDGGRSDSALGELAFRVLDRFGGWKRTPSPEGFWTLTVDRATRKVWEGYGHRVTLETELYPGRGWRMFVGKSDTRPTSEYVREYISATTDGPDAAVGPVLSERDGEDGERLAAAVWPISEPEDAPRLPRAWAFRQAERWMSETAMSTADE